MGGSLLFYLFSKGSVTTAFINSRLSIITTADYILPIVSSAGIITIVVVSVATAIAVMYRSHRIAGPLFRIEKSVDEIGEGNLKLKINLRSTDEIGKMAESINDMTDRLKVHFSEVKCRYVALSDRINTLIKLNRENVSVPDEMRNVLEQISEEKNKMDKAVIYFKVD